MEQEFIIPDNLAFTGLQAIFTKRVDGDRNDPLKGLNLSFIGGISEGEVIKNRSSISSFFGVKLDYFIFPVQRHTAKVSIVTNIHDRSVEADAVITPLKGVVLGVLVADCAPILIYDPKVEVIAAVHAGWRGTASGIMKKTLTLMKEQFNSTLSDAIISIGPSIRWCCYKVDRDVLKAIEKETGNPDVYSMVKENGKFCLDIATANQIQAQSLGVKNIWISKECTFCYPEKFYSYRFYKGITGRQGGFIGMMQS